MRVLVTGSAGFLGRHFVLSHLAAGDMVIGVDDLSANGGKDVPGNVMAVTEVWDLLEWLRDPASEHDKYDLAYHFAAPVGGREKIEGDPLFNAHSLGLDEAFFRWAAVGGTTTAVYPSSSAVYGHALQAREDSGPLHEGMFNAANPNWYAPDEMYGFTKLAGEMLAYKAAKYGLNTLCIRPFSGYGEGQSFDYPVPSIAARVLRREDPIVVWGSGRQARDFVHVDDIVGVTRGKVDIGFKGYEPLNIGSGHATTFVAIARIMAEEVGYKPEIVTDESKPEGVKRRWAAIGRQYFYRQDLITLREGLRRVLKDVSTRIEL